MKTTKIWSKMLMVGMFGMVLSASTVMLSSCATKPIIWDETLPESDAASVYWYTGVNPTSYNGVSIKQVQMPGQKYSSWNMHSVSIPAGNTEIVLNVVWDGGYVRYRGEDFIFKYSFEAGKKYVVTFNVSDDFESFKKDEVNEWGVGIYEREPPKMNTSLGLGKEGFITFVPFLNQPEKVRTSTSFR